MTLDEAIGQYTAYVESEKMGITSFKINTREAEQLAEWLKELKVYREAWSQFSETLTELKDCNTYDNPDVDEVCRFLVNYKNVLERQIKNEEVNADADSD